MAEGHGYPPSPGRAWLEAYYDERPDELKGRERDEREMNELLHRLHERFGGN